MFFKKIKKWLEEMAKRNEQRYGNERLDCCGINRRDLTVKKNVVKNTGNVQSH